VRLPNKWIFEVKGSREGYTHFLIRVRRNPKENVLEYLVTLSNKFYEGGSRGSLLSEKFRECRRDQSRVVRKVVISFPTVLLLSFLFWSREKIPGKTSSLARHATLLFSHCL
jgi:hypothetical protein